MNELLIAVVKRGVVYSYRSPEPHEVLKLRNNHSHDLPRNQPHFVLGHFKSRFAVVEFVCECGSSAGVF